MRRLYIYTPFRHRLSNSNLMLATLSACLPATAQTEDLSDGPWCASWRLQKWTDLLLLQESYVRRPECETCHAQSPCGAHAQAKRPDKKSGSKSWLWKHLMFQPSTEPQPAHWSACGPMILGCWSSLSGGTPKCRSSVTNSWSMRETPAFAASSFKRSGSIPLSSCTSGSVANGNKRRAQATGLA